MPLFILVAMLAVAGVVVSQRVSQASFTGSSQVAPAAAVGRAYVPGLLAFRDAAERYIVANPSTPTGALPTSGVSALIPAGVTFAGLYSGYWDSVRRLLIVWIPATGIPGANGNFGAAAAGELFAASRSSRLVGYSSGGFLVSPAVGQITNLPSAVPDAVPVAIRLF